MTLPTLRLSAFLPYVAPFAPGCPRAVAERMLRLAVIEFCERTRVWRRSVVIPVTSNPVVIPVPAYTALARIEDVWIVGDTKPLEAVVSTELPHAYIGRPRQYSQTNPREIAFAPFDTSEMQFELSLKPANGDEYGTDPADPLHNAFNVVPPFMLADHLEVIKCGALARILLIPDEPFTDPQAAGGYATMFQRAIDDADADSMRMKVRAPRRTKAYDL